MPDLWKRRIHTRRAWVLLALVCLLISCKPRDQKNKPVTAPATEYVAELASATGTVFVGNSDRTEWKQIAVGARLKEGDLVQTDTLGQADIRYSNGNTVSIQASTIFTVRNTRDGSMEISVPYLDAAQPPGDASPSSSGKELSPFVKVDRVVPFGRSLEIVGKVEAGSRLTVNGESVDVEGDGSFKHFTNAFPAATRSASVIMKVTNLAGHSRTIATTHDFEPQGAQK